MTNYEPPNQPESEQRMRIDGPGELTMNPWPRQFDNNPREWFELTGKLPPKREWVGLTDEERQAIAKEKTYWDQIAVAVEAKLKEKNT